MSCLSKTFSTTVVLLITGCASVPTGPSVMVLPGTGVPFNQFRNDDIICQQYASFQVGGTTPNQAAMKSGATSAVVGTALGGCPRIRYSNDYLLMRFRKILNYPDTKL
jgi:hypothetical protein